MRFFRFLSENADSVLTAVERDGRLHAIEGEMFGEWSFTGESYAPDAVRLVSPLEPRHIIGVGKNYVDQNERKPEETPDIPVLFFKPATTVVGPCDDIVLPQGAAEVKFEAELAVVIGRKARNISEAEALSCVFGYTVANDVTAPQYFHPDGHWTVAKSFDTFTPLGPCVETELDLQSVVVSSALNSEAQQHSGLDRMILSIPYLISYMSHVMTLMPGDVLLTGAPAGADFMRVGDRIVCTVSGIGDLNNRVK